MAIDKIVPRYLNKDEDSRIVKSVEMTDNLNIRVSSDENGDAGVIKNAFGNQVVAYSDPSDTLPSGTNRVIGSVTNKVKKETYYFVYNSAGDHSIYRHSVNDANIKLVYQDSVLNFQSDGFVKADYVITEDDNVLLYFTDGVNPPMKINVNRALTDASYPGGATDEEKLKYLTVAKLPPMQAPTFEYKSNASVKFNNVSKKTFQFAYQYIYKDGEHSAISPYSKLAVSSDLYLSNINDAEFSLGKNYIEVTVATANYEVDTIRILGRNENTGPFYIIEDVANNPAVGTVAASFYNDAAYSYVSQNEVNKMYDNVPLKADSQVITDNRLMYGAYTEGYPNVTTSAFKTFRYQKGGDVNAVTASIPTANPTYTEPTNPVVLRFSLANMPNDVLRGTTFYIDTITRVTNLFSNKTSGNYFSNLTWTEEGDGNNARPGPLDAEQTSNNISQIKLPVIEFPLRKEVKSTSNKSIASFANDIIAAINGTYTVYVYPNKMNSAATPSDSDSTYIDDDGTYYLYFKFAGTVRIQLTATYDSANKRINVAHKVVGADLYPEYAFTYSTSFHQAIRVKKGGFFTDALDSSNSGSQWNAWTIKHQNNNNVFSYGFKTFKSGTSHPFGIVYYDDRNRSGGVNDIGEVYSSRIEDRTFGDNGVASLVTRISHNPPSWAKKWQLVYAPKNQYETFLVYSVAEAFFKTSDSDATNDRKIYLSMRHLEGRTDSYKEAKGANLEYSFVDGDIMRVLRYTASNQTFYPKELSFKVVGYEYFTDANTPISDNVATRKEGWFLVVRDSNITGFDASSIASEDFWHHDCIIEILRPKKEAAENIYYEIGEAYDVINASGTYYHDGHRKYNYTWSSGYGNISVNNNVATTSLNIFENDLINIASIDDSYNDVRVTSIQENFDGTISFPVSGINNGSYALSQIQNLSDTVIKIEGGDCYYLPRRIKLNYSPDSHNIAANLATIRYEKIFVETESISDFYDSKSIDIGRANARIKNAKTIKRLASITYSDAFVLDSTVLGLSSFNLSLANFNDFNNTYGAIKYLHNDEDKLMCFQERKISQIPVRRNIINYGSGDSSISISTDVLGTPVFYTGDFGINSNPESFTEYFGMYYFSDIKSGKVIRISSDGITPISDNNMTSYFADKFAASDSSTVRVLGGIDSENDEFIVAAYDVEGSGLDFAVGYNYISKVWTSFYSFIPEGIYSVDNTLYTFKSGRPYKHHSAATRNNFYGTQYDSVVEVVANFNPSMVKTYESISLEGDSVWSAVVSNTDQTTSIATTDFSQRERGYYAYVSRDTTADVTSGSNITTFNGSSEVFSLGEVASVSGSQIVFKNEISNMSFPIGASLYVANGSQADTISNTISSIVGNKTIGCASSVSGVVANNTIIAVGNAGIEGDQLRDYFAKVRITTSESNRNVPFELYGINLVYSKSDLHNELGQ